MAGLRHEGAAKEPDHEQQLVALRGHRAEYLGLHPAPLHRVTAPGLGCGTDQYRIHSGLNFTRVKVGGRISYILSFNGTIVPSTFIQL